MKKYLTAFSMAWGMYCSLPCPIKKWDEKQRSLMLGWLPSVGFAIGIVWALVYLLLVYFSIPYLIVTFFCLFIPFILSGFMHMDGFMDCSDAIMSRKPLPERQKILKDSHAGAFAIICVAFLLFFDYSCIGTAISLGLGITNLVLITVISRTVAGLEVLLSKPMSTSQYHRMHEGDSKEAGSKTAGDKAGSDSENIADGNSESKVEGPDLTGTTIQVIDDKNAKNTPVKQGVILIIIQAILFIALTIPFTTSFISTGLVVAFTAIGTALFARHGKKQLGGMNGDIAGYAILWGEALGMLALMF